MKIILQKKIILFKIKNKINYQKIIILEEKKKTNLIFFLFGLYFKIFFDVGLNVFGTIPFWFSKITKYCNMREFVFFKIFSLNNKTARLFKTYNTFFNNFIKRATQGYFLEFKVIGYFRAKRITLINKIENKKNSKKSFILLYLGYSHVIFLNINANILFVRGKKRFMFFTSYKQEFEKIIKQIFIFKPFNIYKAKGIRTFLNIKKMKPGKQKQQKKVIKK